jgi:hypothetical protein
MVTSDCHLPALNCPSEQFPRGSRAKAERWDSSHPLNISAAVVPSANREEANKRNSLQYPYLNNLRETAMCGKRKEEGKKELHCKTKINQHAPNIEIKFHSQISLNTLLCFQKAKPHNTLNPRTSAVMLPKWSDDLGSMPNFNRRTTLYSGLLKFIGRVTHFLCKYMQFYMVQRECFHQDHTHQDTAKKQPSPRITQCLNPHEVKGLASEQDASSRDSFYDMCCYGL